MNTYISDLERGSSPVMALRQALPYLRLFQDKTFVVKVGGEIFDDPRAFERILEQVSVLHRVGIKVVLVHGGGPQITRAAERLDVETAMVAGRRVTSPEALDVATMVMRGRLGTAAVARLRGMGVPAVAISGVDGGLVHATKRPPVEVDGETVDYGEVGDIASIDPELVRTLTAAGHLTVVCPLSADADGRVLNINADTVAAALACGLGAEKLILMTSADGLLEDIADAASLVSYTDLKGLDGLQEKGAVTTGMLPKLTAVRSAIEGGVPRAHIIGFRTGDSLLTEVFTNEGCGTMIVADRESVHVG